MFIVLLLLWFIFNGKVTVEIALVGAAVCAALTFAWHRIFKVKHHIIVPSPAMVWRSLKYFGGLVIEIVRCNIQVMRLILHPKEEVHPQLKVFSLKLKDERHRVILANSITLTPGTITVALQDDRICVHALDASFMEGIDDSDMEKSLLKMEEAQSHE